MKKLMIGVVVVILLLVAGVLVVLSQAGSLIRQGVVDYGPGLTGTSVSLDAVDVSWLEGEAAIRSLEIGNPAGFNTDYAFRLGTVELALDIKSLNSDVIHINKILIDGADLNYELVQNGSNIQTIQKTVQQQVAALAGNGKATEESDSGASKDVIIDDIYINGTRVSASTALFGGKEASAVLPDIHLQSIGTSEGGIPVGQAVKLVVDAVTKLAVNEVQDSLVSGQLKNAIQDKLGDKVNLDDAQEKLKGLFGK